MHKELFEILEAHPDVYFQVFTNGHFITDEVAKRLRRCGNVTPLISVEGTEIISDQRRGKSGVLSATMTGLQNCLNNKVMTGVCTSLCQTNFEELLREEWVDRLIEMGVLYTWYHVYRPMGPDPRPRISIDPRTTTDRKTIRGRHAMQKTNHCHRCLLRRGRKSSLSCSHWIHSSH